MAPTHAARRDLLLEELETAGHYDVLPEALRAARLSAVPDDEAGFERFVLDHVQEALSGRVHPATALELSESVVEAARAWARPAQATPPRGQPAHVEVAAGAAKRGAETDRGDGADGQDAPTVRPPPPAQARATYDDLASGAVHVRETPVWGADRESQEAGSRTVLITREEALLDLARATLPPGTEILAPLSAALLNEALALGDTGTLVFDAEQPTVPLDKVLAALTDHGAQQVVLWRMAPDAHARLASALPEARRWVQLGAATAEEVVRALVPNR